jgi:hypothetical protein
MVVERGKKALKRSVKYFFHIHKKNLYLIKEN